jgi:hypothetical protein
MDFVFPGVIGLFLLALRAAVMFAIVYFAVRLALRHDRDAAG